jgi:ABC-2 type transport system ATP-binding protein
MPEGAKVIELSLADNYREDIEQLIGEDLIQEAHDKLQDFVRDLAPQLKHDAVLLRQRFSRYSREARRGLSKSDDLNPIISAVLDFSEEVFRAASGQFRREQTGGPVPSRSAQSRVAESTPAAGSEDGDVKSTVTPFRQGPILTLIDTSPATPATDTEILSARVDAAERETDATRFDNLDEIRRIYWRRYRDEQPPDKTVAFACEGISKTYRNNSSFRLAEISFALRVGEITGVVGRNASGKTTLLRIVLGDLLSATGKADYPLLTRTGRGWTHIKRQIAYLPQFSERWSGRLRENLNFVAAAHGMTGKQNREVVDWHIERYGLADYQDATWGEISGGYRIRFELVKALISKPKLLVLDEPLAFLDVIARQEFLRNLQAIATSLEAPVPVIVTSQHLYEIEAVADNMIILDDGACLYCGSLAGIAAHIAFRMVEVSLRTTQKAVQAALDSKGLKLTEPTMDGFILGFPKDVSTGRAYEIIHESFGDRLTAFRDITGSARSLFKEKQPKQVSKTD